MPAHIGSSPPARGTLARWGHSRLLRRFIPARAGNTIASNSATLLYPVHPRPRGEHRTAGDDATVVRGSSPPARGTPTGRCLPARALRFIPARAGNTCIRCLWRSPVSVHPRPRGEHIRERAPEALLAGSSPPARGTPATRDRRGACPPVHPRPRGEHGRTSRSPRWPTGSSPPARGTLVVAHDLDAEHRFIPARAGNTRRGSPIRGRSPVHPRPRGEHAYQLRNLSSVCGSSPPARGTRVRERVVGDDVRFIPARAGNTFSVRWPTSTGPVHPRPRGEHVLARYTSNRQVGSSPPARGTLLRRPERGS